MNLVIFKIPLIKIPLYLGDSIYVKVLKFWILNFTLYFIFSEVKLSNKIQLNKKFQI